jgi:glutathione S-transferase
MSAVVVPADFGYVILVAVASMFLLFGLGAKVGMARKKYGVKYPAMYSDNQVFNCIQRAHQNTLEGYPIFILLLLFGGLQYPCLCSAAGLVWIVGRIFYAKGYYTGEPEKRNQGAFSYIGLLILLGSTLCLAWHLIVK